MNSRELIKMLEQDGWECVAVRGSHHQFKHPVKPGKITVPQPKKERICPSEHCGAYYNKQA